MASIDKEADNFQKQLFITAVYRGDISTTMEVLLSGTIDVNGILDNGRTPLVEAIANENVALVDLLLAHSADPQKPCPGVVQASWAKAVTSPPAALYPMQQALKTANGPIILRMLQAGADLHKSGFAVIDVLQLVIKQVQEPDTLLELLLSKLEENSTSVSKYNNQLSALLVTAVTKRKLSLVEALLNKGANPNHRLHGSDVPVLVLAANEGDLEICRTLVEAGAVLNNLSYIEDVRPLTSAVEAGFTKAVSTLIQLGAEVNVCSHLHIQKVSLLHMAVACRNMDVVRLLLDAGAQLKVMGNQQVTPLHIVCQDDSDPEDLMALLLSRVDQGADVLDVKNARGQSALLLACHNQCLQCVQLLVAKGADVNTIDGNGDSALHHAVRSGSDICVQTLVSGDAKVNSGRCMGCTPLLSAIWLGYPTLVELLIEAGADVLDTKEGNQETGLHLAIEAQSVDVLELLLGTGMLNVNTRTNSGDTPLMLAARSGSERACQLLTEHGAHLNLTDNNQGETALSLSVYFGKEDNACWLIKEGANVNIADQTGLSPMYWAFFNCRIKVLTLLLLADTSLTLHQLNHTYPRNLSIMSIKPLIEWVRAFLKTPRRLQDLCRIQIRRTLQGVVSGTRITGHLSGLPLPERLRDYIAYRRLDDIPDFTQQLQNSDGVTVDHV